jgi:hypothetical protein
VARVSAMPDGAEDSEIDKDHHDFGSCSCSASSVPSIVYEPMVESRVNHVLNLCMYLGR